MLDRLRMKSRYLKQGLQKDALLLLYIAIIELRVLLSQIRSLAQMQRGFYIRGNVSDYNLIIKSTKKRQEKCNQNFLFLIPITVGWVGLGFQNISTQFFVSSKGKMGGGRLGKFSNKLVQVHQTFLFLKVLIRNKIIVYFTLKLIYSFMMKIIFYYVPPIGTILATWCWYTPSVVRNLSNNIFVFLL